MEITAQKSALPLLNVSFLPSSPLYWDLELQETIRSEAARCMSVVAINLSPCSCPSVATIQPNVEVYRIRVKAGFKLAQVIHYL